MGYTGHTIEHHVYGTDVIPAPAEEAPVNRVRTVKCRVTPGEAEAWREAAHEARVSVSELVRVAVSEHLERQAAPTTSSPTSALDELLERVRA